MKKTITALSLMAAVSACSTSSVYEKRAEAARERRVELQEETVSHAPDWFSSPPQSSDTVIYSTGTYASTNWEMADRTAIDLALGKVCVTVSGKVNQQSKVYQRDVNGQTQEYSETAIQNQCLKTKVTGFVIDQKEQFTDSDGRIRVYVLVAYPIGSANALKESVIAEENKLSTIDNANDAIQDLNRAMEAEQ
jgi:hypothetical protein